MGDSNPDFLQVTKFCIHHVGDCWIDMVHECGILATKGNPISGDPEICNCYW
jgi:hypothetical protein